MQILHIENLVFRSTKRNFISTSNFQSVAIECAKIHGIR